MPTARARTIGAAGRTLAERLIGETADHLFPPPPGPRRGWISGTVVFLVASVVSLLRVPPALVDTVWAEDGTVFLQQALDRSAADTLATAYNGYLHLYPRLVAELVTWTPVAWAGWVFSVAAAIAVGLAAWAVWTLGTGLIPSRALRAAVAAAVVLVPAGAFEAAGNVANSHWYLVFAAFWALVGRATSTSRLVAQTLIVLLAVLSDPLSAVLAPLALVRLVALRTRRDRTVAVVYLMGLVGQLAVAVTQERENTTPAALDDAALGYVLRVVSPSALGLEGTDRLVAAAGPWGISALALVVALVLAAAVLALPRRRLPVLAAALASVAFFAIACFFAVGTRYPPTGDQIGDLYTGSRYTLVPSLLLVTAVALVGQGLLDRYDRSSSPVRVAVPALVLVPTALFLLGDYRADAPSRAGVVAWSQQVDDVRAACSTAPTQEEQTLVIAPGIPWHVDLTCTEARDG